MARKHDKADLFLDALEIFGESTNQLEREYKFHPSRKWAFDFAHPKSRVAVEVDGGQWLPGGGRHGGDADREKMNEAAALGWRVLHFSPKQLTDDPERCVEVFLRARDFFDVP